MAGFPYSSRVIAGPVVTLTPPTLRELGSHDKVPPPTAHVTKCAMACPLTSRTAQMLDAPFSAEVTGTVRLGVASNSGAELSFLCDFGSATLAYVHIDDHLVCSTGVNSPSGNGKEIPESARTQYSAEPH